MAQPYGGQQPEGIRKAQQLMRDGKTEEALAAVRAQLAASPDSPQVATAAGNLLDLMGRGADARKAFQKAIDLGATPAAKANAERAMAMSYAFESDCQDTARYEQMVFDYWVTRTSADPHNAYYQQGEMADEAARVCIDSGDLDTAYKYYKMGYEAGHPGAGYSCRPPAALGVSAGSTPRRASRPGAATPPRRGNTWPRRKRRSIRWLPPMPAWPTSRNSSFPT